MEIITAEHETTKTSYQNKNKTLEKKIEILSSELEEKREELKLEKRNDVKKSKKESEKFKNKVKMLK